LGTWRFWSQIDAGSWIRPQVSWSSLIQGQLLCNGCEEFSDIYGSLGGSFEEEQSSFFGICFGIGCLNSSLVRIVGDHIHLVTGQCNDNVLVCLSLEFFDP
jgi:hypothetical protein